MKIKLQVLTRRKSYLAISIILVTFSLTMLLIRGFNFGIDLAGGTIAQFELHRTFDVEEIKSILDEFDSGAEITTVGDNGTIVHIGSGKDFSEEEKVTMFNKFKTAFKLDDDDLLSFNRISASVGSDMRRQAIVASAVTVVLILLYITLRFKFLFGVSAILALLHDLIIVIGVYATFDIPINSSFIAAMLTILGYSINNTIIIFDRIRERIKSANISDYYAIVEESVDATFTRSLNTTMTTVIAVLAVYIFGVDAVREFTLPMMVGFIAGTYSSVFVSSTLWYLFTMNKAHLKPQPATGKKR